MKKSPFVLITKGLLDVMFYIGAAIFIGIPYLFRLAGKYYNIFDKFYIPFCIIYMIAGIFALAIIWNLRLMLRTVIREDPFVKENVNSLRRMGRCAFIIAAIMTLKFIFVITPATIVLVIVFIIAGLFSLVLSQVFDKAVTYKQENDLTI